LRRWPSGREKMRLKMLKRAKTPTVKRKRRRFEGLVKPVSFNGVVRMVVLASGLVDMMLGKIT